MEGHFGEDTNFHLNNKHYWRFELFGVLINYFKFYLKCRKHFGNLVV